MPTPQRQAAAARDPGKKSAIATKAMQMHRAPIFLARDDVRTSGWTLTSGLFDDLRPLGLVDDADAEFFGFLELRARAGPGDDEIRFRAD